MAVPFASGPRECGLVGQKGPGGATGTRRANERLAETPLCAGLGFPRGVRMHFNRPGQTVRQEA